MSRRISYIVGDITEQEVEVIVNAANKSLLGGGGVDGAIHRAAGVELYEECLRLGGCEAGEAKITEGYNLPAKYVIHTVGPVFGQEQGREEELLAACYRNALKIVKEHGLRSVVFPAISTGAFGYPSEEARQIAVATITEYLVENNLDIEVGLISLYPEYIN